MRYIFEVGHYPDQKIVDEKEFETDDLARAHAVSISADCAWDTNPNSIYQRQEGHAK